MALQGNIPSITDQPQSVNSLGALQNNYFSGVQLNRIHRNEPQQFIGNFGQNLPTVDYQLQNLIAQSGVSTFLPSDNRDDLNIVSKALSLNFVGHHNDSKGRQSDLSPTYVQPLSNVIQPPI
ncbi:hypothetical protein O3M35_007877 [Rhynocoris fuscipes]|uniref:Uncharacterized protein n=1 Tax=Rhynocoris fuscipes TaxID=488301 RepID=A0AAW1DDJ6_9HEMI